LETISINYFQRYNINIALPITEAKS